MTDVLHLSDIGKSYGDLQALGGIDLTIPGNAYVSLLGPSGSGKTTLLRVIAGFEQPDRGSVRLNGRPIGHVPAHRRGIGFVFQNFALFPHLSVAGNIAYGLENRETGALTDRAVLRRKVGAIIDLVGLLGLEDRGVAQISGGQRQRVALARTLVTEPHLVLLDEPLGALDANLRARMRTELRQIRERLGVTFLHVTGSESEALAMGDTVLVLDRGRIAQAADADTIYNRPASPAVARFLNCYNLFDGAVDGEAFVGPAGRFAIGGGPRLPGGGPAYAVRYDRIEVRPVSAPPAPDEVRVEAAFVASEYSGAAVNAFFALDNGQVVEVEAHLSHRPPADYAPQQRYGLVWKRDRALLFA
ncbi:ABC transporter ATP-binding protein [Labrys wisconsinensis]|uniref:Spermidine/putrescine transport system ATP-binding protein n=1 Tax=Labrys wisconsinensis TaxID=425677 RepID=A0ABU0JD18_9HYPH|nr:ABC transporter ATP-binding protein [Labrys wisconsinensis]MDQ0472182.1 putative spermidine/putrescine transport system ATP-binding protein [Labrys wisconsinensis]